MGVSSVHSCSTPSVPSRYGMDLGSTAFGLLAFLSYRVVAVCLASVPLTHAIGVYLHCPKYLRPWRYLTFPFTGGNRHLVLQLLGWALWGLSALTILPISISFLPVFLAKDLPKIPNTHVDVVSGAAAVISLIGELFMIKAILVYDSSGSGRSSVDGGLKRAGSNPTSNQQPVRHASKVSPHPAIASAVVVLLGLLLSATGFLLLLLLEYMPDVPSRVLYCCLSLSCLLVASSTTYGLGGFLRYGQGSTARAKSPAGAGGKEGGHAFVGKGTGSGGGAGGKGEVAGLCSGLPEDTGGWSFYQPLRGGTVFVATQAVGWSTFAATIVLIAVLLQQLVAGVALCLRCLALATGTLMMVAQLLLALSLVAWRANKGGHPLLRAASDTLRTLSGSGPNASTNPSWINRNMPILLMYLPVHVFFTLWAFSFTFMPYQWALTVWVAFLLPYYGFTMVGHPQHSGCRQWPWLMAWFESSIETALTAWFGSVEVVMDSEGSESGPMLTTATAGAAVPGGEAAASTSEAQKQQQQHVEEGSTRLAVSAADAQGCVARAAAGQPSAIAAAVTRPDGGDSCAAMCAPSVQQDSTSEEAPDSSSLGCTLDGASCSSDGADEGSEHSNSPLGRIAAAVATATAAAAQAAVGQVKGPQSSCWKALGSGQATSIAAGTGTAGDHQATRSVSSSSTATHSQSSPDKGGSTSSHHTTSQPTVSSGLPQHSSTPNSSKASSSTTSSSSSGDGGSQGEGRRYIFGFQPHGFYPTGAGFLPWMPSFRSLFPGVNPVTLVASILYIPPFIRDISCWAGFRQVTRNTFLRALRERAAVILCPGGQAELVHTWKAFHRDGKKRKLVLYGRHKGFCRIAIEQQAHLVPVLALGEMLQLENMFNFPALQKITYKRFGFPVPFVLVGRWGLTPLPRKTPLVYVVGQPLSPPPHEPGTPVPQDVVDKLHELYYERLQGMWRRHRHRHPSFADAELVLIQ